MELTQALIQAAQSASQAAEAATTASAAQASGGGDGPVTGSLKRDLAKLIPRPNSFNPVDREQEVLQWTMSSTPSNSMRTWMRRTKALRMEMQST